MSIISDMKKLHAKKFREGKIKQASFLKSFKKEILELVTLEYTPAEICGYLEEKLDVRINMNSFYAWLRYIKQDKNIPRGGSGDQHIANNTTKAFPEMDTPTPPTSAIDVLSSTDFD